MIRQILLFLFILVIVKAQYIKEPYQVITLKSLTLEKNKTTQLIEHLLRDYGNIHTYGFKITANKYPHMKLKHHIIGFYLIPTQGYSHIMAITYTLPKEHYTCHTCSSKISFFEFKILNGQMVLENTYINTLEFGSLGNPPTQNDIQIVKVSKHMYGVLFDSIDAGQGYTLSYKDLYILYNLKVKNIFSKQVGMTDDGAKDISEDSWEMSFSLNQGNTSLYDIKLHKIGIENGKPVNENTFYKYNGKKYIQQIEEFIPN